MPECFKDGAIMRVTIATITSTRLVRGPVRPPDTTGRPIDGWGPRLSL